jgi:hypothetical protein
MWSGPRNISTAMMRSWGNRPDTVVCDEPFYANYLRATGRDHPGADEVIATGETDWRKVVQRLRFSWRRLAESLDDVYRADEMFCTGTMGELAGVIKVDERIIGGGEVGPMTRRLSGLFAERTAREGVEVA